MAIAFSKYVSILSTVQGSPIVQQRELIGRIFSINPLLPTETVVEFTSADDVKAYFGATSEEYRRAFFYFNWLSKNNTRPRKLGFAFWAQAATDPLIFGAKASYALAQFTGIGAGVFTLTLGAVSHAVDVDFSGDADLAAVAATAQAAIRAAGVASGAIWTASTVVYNAVRGSFDFTAGAAGAAAISVADGAETPATALGWRAGAIFSDGVAVQAIEDLLADSVTASNNFGSFCFTNAAALALQDVVDAATWNATQNVAYQFTVAVSAANAAAWSAALLVIAGVELTLTDAVNYPNEYDEMVPMIVLAATNYAGRYATQNYMFQPFPTLTPKVTDTPASNAYDALRVNYYGVTQQAGNLIAFYQRGVMMGGQTSPVDINIYANEQWLKDAMAAAVMNLLMASPEVPANERGQGMITGAHQPVIEQAKFNGAISVGKSLTPLQITVIGELTEDDKAWRQVQTIGYWYAVGFESYVTEDDRTEYKAVYLLVYSKDDVVRKVEGTHALI